MGHRSSKCSSLIEWVIACKPLHALGKFPEISRNYLPAVVLTIFKVFPLVFQ